MVTWLGTGRDFVTVEVVARPGSGKRGLLKTGERGLFVGLASQPEKGKANQELIELFASLTKVSRAAVTIIRGARSRHKIIRIATTDPASVTGKLLEASSLSSKTGASE